MAQSFPQSYFSKHLLGLENNEVDIKMINKDIPKNK